MTLYRAINNNPPPLRIFGGRIFPEVFIILQKSWQNFLWLLLFSKKFRLRRALIIIFFSEGQIWALRRSIFKQNPRFCLKIPLKNFRLRRAGRSRFLLFSKFSRLRRALIIIIFSKSEFFLGSYYSLKISRIFSSALIIIILRGVLIIIIPVVTFTSRYDLPPSAALQSSKPLARGLA